PLVQLVQRVVQVLPQRRTAVELVPELVGDAVNGVLRLPQGAHRQLDDDGGVRVFPHGLRPLPAVYPGIAPNSVWAGAGRIMRRCCGTVIVQQKPRGGKTGARAPLLCHGWPVCSSISHSSLKAML